MAKLNLENHLVFTYEYDPYRELYWYSLSRNVTEKFGNGDIIEIEKVDECLTFCFNFFVGEFEKIIREIPNFKFICYLFKLHEDSMELMLKERDKKLDLFSIIDEYDFARYRRILKISLEQFCKIDLNWGVINQDIVSQFDDAIQKLFYLGTWLYSIADIIADHRMLNGAYYITFEDEQIVFNWKNYFGKLKNHLLQQFSKGFETGVFDENGTVELRAIIESSFNVKYDLIFGLPFHIKKHHSNSICQTIEYKILLENLKLQYPQNSEIELKNIIEGLVLSKDNVLSLNDTILKPYSTDRFLFRPYLVYNVENDLRLLTSENKFAESMYVLSTNAIQWNTLNKEWLTNKSMKKYITRKGNEHDKLLEVKIEELLLINNIKYARNLKSFKTLSASNINIDNQICGEIDFIIIDSIRKEIIIADSKYNKARFESVGYRQDFTNFNKKYETQLSKKIEYISQNKEVVQIHFNKIFSNFNESILEYNVIGMFIINTPTFYMFCSPYLTIDKHNFEKYILGNEVYPEISLEYEQNKIVKFNYPYFK